MFSNYIITGSPLAPRGENGALSGECKVPALREWRTRHSKRTPLRGPLSAPFSIMRAGDELSYEKEVIKREDDSHYMCHQQSEKEFGKSAINEISRLVKRNQ